MIEGRTLRRADVPGIWRIDRSERIERVYRFVDGALVLEPHHFDAKGWPPGEPERYTPILEDCADRGGWLYGFFDDDKPIGAVVLESRLIGKRGDQLQLAFLHVGNGYRDRGFGRQLFGLAANVARERGARNLYVSATPSEHTIHFYMGLGCTLAAEPDPELFALEPEDIHLEFDLLRASD